MKRPAVCEQCEVRCIFAKRSTMKILFSLNEIPSWCRKKEEVFAQVKKRQGGTLYKMIIVRDRLLPERKDCITCGHADDDSFSCGVCWLLKEDHPQSKWVQKNKAAEEL